MLVSDLITEVRQELQEASAAEWTDAELTAYLVDGDLVINQLLEWRQKTTILVPVLGQQDYTIPDDVMRLQRVTFDRRFLPQTTQYELDRDEGNWRGAGNNTPRRYFIKQWDTLSLYPKPAAAGIAISFTGEVQTATAATTPGTFASFDHDTSLALNPWSDPSNAGASDNAYATVTITNSANSESLRSTNLGFAIPADAVIVGVLMEFECSRSGGSANLSTAGHLVYNGANIGTVQGGDGFATVTDAYVNVGGATTTWGATLTPTIINDSSFGVDARFTGNIGGNTTGQIDHIRVTVYYLDDTGSEYGEIVWFESPADTVITSYATVASETGLTIAVEDSSGGQVYFEHDPAGDPHGTTSAELGIVIDWDTCDDNVELYYAAVPDALTNTTDTPQMHPAVQPALVPYVVFRCYERSGSFQNTELAALYFQDFADWLNSVMIMKGRQWPERGVALEPVSFGNDFVARLNELGFGKFLSSELRAHYE